VVAVTANVESIFAKAFKSELCDVRIDVHILWIFLGAWKVIDKIFSAILE